MDFGEALPAPGSADERAAFLRLQERLPGLFRDIFSDRNQPRTVVVVPGLSLDPEVLAKVSGARHYEERMLSMFMLLRLPRTRLVYLSSEPIAQPVVDYALNMLGGVPAGHARRRLVMLSTHDASPQSLTRKLLDRPRLLARIREAIGDPRNAHLSVFNATADEVSLAVALGIPMYACDPALGEWGSKSGSRRAFRAAGIPLPDGTEDLQDFEQVAEAINGMLGLKPDLRRVVVKLDEGFSGEGNAALDVSGFEAAPGAERILQALREDLCPEAEDLDIAAFEKQFGRHHGIVEAWVEGEDKRTPSVQVRINPLGGIELISSHEQVMTGRGGQVFEGSRFPALPDYAKQLHDMGIAVAAVLRDKGVIGRFSLDFVSSRDADAPSGWRHHAIEINLRKGGTTLPYQMLQFLTDGQYCPDAAEFRTPMGQVRCYRATDNLVNPDYRRLVPQDLIDLLVEHRLHFDQTTQKGIVFNLIGALSQYGKLGMVCIAETPDEAEAMFQEAKSLLDREAAAG